VASAEEMRQLWAELELRWPESVIEPSLVRIASVVELLGDPQRAFRVIQVTGTNGKTSTARMIEALLRAQGLRTGLFTSPHLLDPCERICLDGEPITHDVLLRTWREIKPLVEVVDGQSIADGGPALSFFEVMTALAYAAFADTPVDVAVVEVGMGGTWDATSVATAEIAVITPIDLDHQEYLGDDVRDIAREKAGIIAADSVAVIAEQTPDVTEILLERCSTVHAQPVLAGVDFAVESSALAVGGQQVNIRAGAHGYTDIFLPLFGQHQAQNAATALAAVTWFMGGRALPAEAVEGGFGAVTSPGRLEVVRRNPTIVVDTAHNPHGLRATMQAMNEAFAFTSVVALFGVLDDKDATGMLRALADSVSSVVLTQPSSGRARSVEDLTELATEILGAERVWISESLADGIDRAVTLSEEQDPYGGAGVLITGSVVLVGESLRLLGRTR
jgi:dihydrofolate synthase / folylpolyglutamate synthase